MKMSTVLIVLFTTAVVAALVMAAEHIGWLLMAPMVLAAIALAWFTLANAQNERRTRTRGR